MNRDKIVPLVKGIIKHLPYTKKFLQAKTGGTDQSRYCYSVWLRHLRKWLQFSNELPEIVAELGPGDSLGVGLAALLSGCKSIHALDVVQYWDNEKNIEILHDLVCLFNDRSAIPDNIEYPKVRPNLENYDFPADAISDIQLKKSLAEKRVSTIIKDLQKVENPTNLLVKWKIPWWDSKVIENNSVDFIFSQAVLEHVDDLENTYYSMKKWLKPNGLMSHTIDFKSHGSHKSWNGHWSFSDYEWRIVKGGKKFLINRCPLSIHIALLAKYGFTVLDISCDKMENTLPRKYLAKKFKNLTDEDLTTSGVHILSRKNKF